MSGYLTEPEAWLEIARRIAEGQWMAAGLCHEVVALHLEGRICTSTEDDMWRRIHFRRHTKTWAYPRGTAAEARILAALWLSLEAEEEVA